MTGEEFGFALLAAIQENVKKNNEMDPLLLKSLQSLTRKALGLKEEENHRLPEPIPQLKVPKEFPQTRIKYDSLGNELARRQVSSMEEFKQILREDPLFPTWIPLRD
jgi:hypothetical protein